MIILEHLTSLAVFLQGWSWTRDPGWLWCIMASPQSWLGWQHDVPFVIVGFQKPFQGPWSGWAPETSRLVSFLPHFPWNFPRTPRVLVGPWLWAIPLGLCGALVLACGCRQREHSALAGAKSTGPPATFAKGGLGGPGCGFRLRVVLTLSVSLSDEWPLNCHSTEARPSWGALFCVA